jgi:hypothetical protein
MLNPALVLAVLAAADGTTLAGDVRLTRAVGAPLVSVVTQSGAVELRGDLAAEVGRLQSAKVEVVGTLDVEGKRLTVSLYRILDVGGTRPLVGTLIEVADGLALKDGEGTPIPLSLQPRTLERLREAVGAKLWVAGKKLLSGQLQVQRYGILRDPPKIEALPAVP